MVVGPARCKQSERRGHRADHRHGLGLERPVVDLEAAQPEADQLAEQRHLRRRLREVRQHRQPAGVADRLDRLPRAKALARHVRRPAPADEPPERVLDARREPGRDQGPGDRRPAQRVVVVRIEPRHLVVDRQADLAQLRHGPLEPDAAAPRAAKRASPRTPRRRGPSRSRGCAARPSWSGMPRASALISTPVTSSIGAGIARPRTRSRIPASVSWSVIASVVMPAAAASRTSSTGVRTPSERRVWV